MFCDPLLSPVSLAGSKVRDTPYILCIQYLLSYLNIYIPYFLSFPSNMALMLQTLVLVASATRVFASCAHGTFLSPRAEGGTVEVKTFGYSGTIVRLPTSPPKKALQCANIGMQGPLNWAALEAPANSVCATGTKQSPIDMVDGVFTVIPGTDVQITVNDMPDGAEFENLGTTVEVITQGGTLDVGGKQFELQQFHFHLPSEHLDNGTSQASTLTSRNELSLIHI